MMTLSQTTRPLAVKQPRPSVRSRARVSPIVASASSTSTDRPASEVIKNLKPGEYFRPPPEQTSGFRGNDARFKRSPCPCLNTLANHGFISRDGTGISVNMLAEACDKVFNLDPKATKINATIIKVLSNSLPGFKFSLSDLSFHNRGEHDASLVHDDLYFGKDPSAVNKEYAEQLFALSKDGKTIGVDEVSEHRRNRIKDSKARNPEYYMEGLTRKFTHAEAGLLLCVMGHKGKLPVSQARSFLVEEKIPDDYVRPSATVVSEDIKPIVEKITELNKND